MVMANIFNHNLNQGFPMHFRPKVGPGPYMAKAAANSKLHKMNKEVKSKLKKLHQEWPEDVINSVLAASLLHSGEHFYLDKHISYVTYSKYLKQDISFVRSSLIGLNKYYTRTLKCCQRLDDPVCKVLYETTAKYDPEFSLEISFAVSS